MVQSGIYYVQKGNLGYLSDHDWDGDCFTSDPANAIKRTEPWRKGRGTEQYTCVKIRIDYITIAQHPGPLLKAHKTAEWSRHKGRIRYRFECPRCKATTKSYATEASALGAWKSHNKRCTITVTTILREAPGKDQT